MVLVFTAIWPQLVSVRETHRQGVCGSYQEFYSLEVIQVTGRIYSVPDCELSVASSELKEKTSDIGPRGREK